jgi:hypothetical protein
MGQAYRDGDIVATDAAGNLPLKMSEDPAPPSSPVQMRSFTPLRHTQGPLTLRYRADVTPAEKPRKPGPSYDLRGTDGGFGGAFFSFLLLPKNPPASYDLSLHWDFSALPAGAHGVTTRGEGDVAALVPADEMGTIFLLGGKVGSYSPAGSLFHAHWIGRPPFDPQANAEWTAKSFAMLRDYFRDTEAKPFYLLMRPFPLPRDGGGATRGGFMLEYGQGALSDAARRFMFTHEMIHHFVGSLDGDSGKNAWFGEGLAEFYKVRLPLRNGLADIKVTAAEIGNLTNAYYMGRFVSLSFDEAAARRWTDREVQAIPYNRGFMYFVNLDARVRAASRGRRSLDDLIHAMLASRRAGHGYDEGTWRELLHAELGQAGIDDFEQMLAGKLIVPPPDAFGACMERRERTIPRPTLGFEENSLLVKPYVVTSLTPESAAARAGLRESDTIVSFTGAHARIAHSAPNIVLDPVVQLDVKRNGSVEHVRFSTEGPRVPEYYWTPRSGTSTGCAF